jgi:hypothetical protein
MKLRRMLTIVLAIVMVMSKVAENQRTNMGIEKECVRERSRT